MKQLIVTDEQFKKLTDAERGEAIIRKQLLPVIKAEGERQIKFVISTEAVDRVNDSIAADGWELANFLKNPVVLWAHMRHRNDVLLGNDQEMHGCPRVDVVKGEQLVVLVHLA